MTQLTWRIKLSGPLEEYDTTYYTDNDDFIFSFFSRSCQLSDATMNFAWADRCACLSCEFLPCSRFLFLLLVYIPHYNVSNDTSLITSTIFAGLFNLLQEAKNITICPRHRDVYGTRWMLGKKRCSIPKRFSGHNTKLPPKVDRGVSFAQAKALYQELGIVIAIGMRKYRSLKEQNICTNYNSVVDSFFIIV